MIDQKNAQIAAFALRLSLGVMYLAHSIILKYLTFTLAGTAQFFESLGLPAALAYLTFAGEALGGIALVLGFKSRLVSLALIPVLLGAFWVHSGNGWVFSAANGGWEYPAFWACALIVQALLGDAPPWTHRAIDGGSGLRLPDVDGVARAIVASAQPPAAP